RLSGRREETQNVEAVFTLQLQHDAGRISGEMGLARRLSDGGAELRRATLGIREKDRPRTYGLFIEPPPQELIRISSRASSVRTAASEWRRPQVLRVRQWPGR